MQQNPKVVLPTRSIPPPIISILRLLIVRLLILLHFSALAHILRLLGIVKVASVRVPGSWRLVPNWPGWRNVRDWGGWRITDHTISEVIVTTFGVVVFLFIQFRSVYPFHVLTILPNIFRERIGYSIPIV
jgi:hypothetical protein